MKPAELEHWERLEALFDGALALPDAERDAWLASSTADEALRAEVARLLAAHRRAGGILDRGTPVPNGAEAMRNRLDAALRERYEFEREIGRGGMAIVYLAHETKHDRRVVLKVLRPEVGAAFGAQRFVREVQLAAQLAHPHIVPLLDSGDADGLLYYVMPWVDGETLRARLSRVGSLSPVEATALLRDVADALGHAHAHGVVHRDLKPENVFCAGEHAYLLDFGIAKPTAPNPADERLTQENAAIGTPAYMAPEQRVASATVDARADVYAWGMIAHEMLTGSIAPALSGETPLRARVDIAPSLADVVIDALAPNAAERPADGHALLARLDRVTTATARPRRGRRFAMYAALVALGGIAGVAAYIGSRRERDLTAPEVGRLPSPIAVAALTNETGDTTLAAWGRLAGDWVTQGLHETGFVPVVTWTTALDASERLAAARREGRVVDPVAFIRDETGARSVITGSYYRTGDSLRFTASLVDARNDRPLGTTLAVVVPRDSAQQAVRLLRDRLMASVAILADERLAAVPDLVRRPPAFEAYQAFDRAIQHFAAQEYGASAPEFREAYALDSTFLSPLLYAATAYFNTAEYVRADTMLRTLRRHRELLSAYHRGWAEFLEAVLAGDGQRALVAVRGAAALAPQSRAGYDLAQLAVEMDRPTEALDVLDHMSPDRGDMRGWSSYWTQRTHAEHLLGKHERELADARELRRRFPDRRVGLVLEVRALAALRRHAALDTIIASARSLPPTTYWSAGAAMVVAGEELIAHGDSVAGQAWLEQGIAWLRAEQARTPGERSHRYWLGDALYSLGRFAESRPVLEALARDYPDRLQYRGMAALAAARTGDAAAERVLGASEPRERGVMAVYRGRLAAVRGDDARAASLLADAVQYSVDGLAWMHSAAYIDLALLAKDKDRLPASLRP